MKKPDKRQAARAAAKPKTTTKRKPDVSAPDKIWPPKPVTKAEARAIADRASTKADVSPKPKAKPGPKPKASKAPPKRAAKPKAAPKPKRPMAGRPSKYSPEVSEKICQHIASGGTINGLDKLDDPSLPTACVAWGWIQANPDFHSRYVAATELRLARWPEQVVEIADEQHTDSDAIAHAKLRIDVRLRLMHKLGRPAESGSGSEGSTTALSGMSWEEKVAHAADLFRTLGILVEDDKPEGDKR